MTFEIVHRPEPWPTSEDRGPQWAQALSTTLDEIKALLERGPVIAYIHMTPDGAERVLQPDEITIVRRGRVGRIVGGWIAGVDLTEREDD